MADQQPEAAGVQLRLRSLVGWLVCLPGLIGVFGAYASWLVARGPGLWAQAAVAAVVLPVMLANGWLTVSVARSDPAKVSAVFSASSILRIGLCLLLVWGIGAAADLPFNVLFVWLLIFYLSALAAECAWVTLALRRYASGKERELVARKNKRNATAEDRKEERP